MRLAKGLKAAVANFGTFRSFLGLKIAGWGATAASAGAYHAAAAAAAMKSSDLGPYAGHHPAAHHQLMADMYQGMSPATAINTMDWKNTSQVGITLFLAFVNVAKSGFFG